MGRSAVFSGLLHVAVILLTVLGLPWLYSEQEVLQATSVTTITDAQLAELQSKTPHAQKRQDQPKDETIPPAPDAPPVPEPEVEPEPEPEAEAEPPPEPAPPEPEPAPPAPVAVVPEPEPAPPAPEPAPPEPEPQPQAEIAPAPQEPVIAEPQPEPQPEEPVVPPEQQLAEAQPKPVPPKKPKKKEDVTRKDEPKKTEVAKKDDPIEKIKKDIESKKAKSQSKKPKKSPPAESTAALVDPDPGIPQRLPFGEEDAIRRQIQPNWNYNPGLPGIEKMTVDLIIIMNPDGTVQRVDFADPGAVNSSPDYRAFCESARRAVRLSSPLKMPPNRPYDLWKRIIMGFRVEDL